MGRQLTVLLIQTTYTPPGVVQQLEKRGVRLESVRVPQVSGWLVEGRPDLVVLGLPAEAPASDQSLVSVRFSMRVASCTAPLVALAAWPLDYPPPAGRLVDAVVPLGLPPSTIAHRIRALAERNVSGNPIESTNPPSSRSSGSQPVAVGELKLERRAVTAVSKKASVARGDAQEGARRDTKRVVAVPAESAKEVAVNRRVALAGGRSGSSGASGASARVSPSGLASPGSRARPEGRYSSQHPPCAESVISGTERVKGATPEPPSSSDQVTPEKTLHAQLKVRSTGIHDMPTSPINLPPNEFEDDEDTKVGSPDSSHDVAAAELAHALRESTRAPATQVEVAGKWREFSDGDPQNQLGKWLTQARDAIPESDAHPAIGQRDTVRPPALSDRAPEAGKETPSSSASSATSSIRVPLTTPGAPLSGVRALLVDEDLSRADALAKTLRAHRVQVHMTSPRLEYFHARLLRKFTPHVVIIDEAAMGAAASDFLARLRDDPFLQHTQLLVVRLDRMFRPRSGSTQVDALLPMLKPLAQAEISLLEKLGPTCEVEFGLDEVPPHLLLKLLVPRPVSTQIECTRDDESLRWTVGWDCASNAELIQAGNERVLPHEEAFDWLLSHRNCKVVVIHRPEKEPLRGSPVLDLIERRISKNERPEGRLRAAVRPRLESLVDLEQPEGGMTDHPVSTTRPVTFGRAPSEGVEPAKNRRVRSWGAVALVAAAGALGAVALQKSTLGVRGAGEPAMQSALHEVDADQFSPGAPEPVQPTVAPKSDGEADVPRDELFFVEEEDAPSCELILDSWTPAPGQPRTSGLVYFREAQQHLLSGHEDQAAFSLCQSATLLPGGPGSVELVRYYLNRRAYSQAEHHLDVALAEKPDNLEILMLQGDLENQRGRLDRSRNLWLEALEIEEAFGKLAISVGRKYFRDAQESARQVAWPRTERYLRRAVTLAPDYAPAARMLGEVLGKREEKELSQRWMTRAKQLEAPQPRDPVVAAEAPPDGGEVTGESAAAPDEQEPPTEPSAARASDHDSLTSNEALRQRE